MKRMLWLAIRVILVAVIALYAIDWAALWMRTSRGRAYDTVQVDEYLQTPLKGNKAEYDYIGSQPVSCVRTLFPHSGMTPCWWLRRHPARWE
jgi:hypothetical protein